MILIDANIWIAHFDHGEPTLADMLPRRDALIHPFTIAEIALGRFPGRDAVLAELALLPTIVVARHQEVMHLIEARNVSGIGYVDTHLLASALLAPGTLVWTRDKRLRRMADQLSLLSPFA